MLHYLGVKDLFVVACASRSVERIVKSAFDRRTEAPKRVLKLLSNVPTLSTSDKRGLSRLVTQIWCGHAPLVRVHTPAFVYEYAYAFLAAIWDGAVAIDIAVVEATDAAARGSAEFSSLRRRRFVPDLRVSHLGNVVIPWTLRHAQVRVTFLSYDDVSDTQAWTDAPVVLVDYIDDAPFAVPQCPQAPGQRLIIMDRSTRRIAPQVDCPLDRWAARVIGV